MKLDALPFWCRACKTPRAHAYDHCRAWDCPEIRVPNPYRRKAMLFYSQLELFAIANTAHRYWLALRKWHDYSVPLTCDLEVSP